MATSGRAAIFIYPWDITDEGIENCFATLEDTCGLNEVNVAAAYHAGTYFLPHNPKRTIYWGEDGDLYFLPAHPRWQKTRAQPHVSSLVDGPAYMHNIVDEARRRGFGLNFWIVYFFNRDLAVRQPQLAPVNALGHLHGSLLCPGNADAREFALAMTEDLLCTYRADGLFLESLSFGPYDYGPTLNKLLSEIIPQDQYLLSLCFCGHCLARAVAEGVDGLEVKRLVAEHLRKSLPELPRAETRIPVTEPWLKEFIGGKLWPYLEVRTNTQTSLTLEVVRLADQYGAFCYDVGGGTGRDVRGHTDHDQLRPYARRVGVTGGGSSRPQEVESIRQRIGNLPETADAYSHHWVLDYESSEALEHATSTARDAGVTNFVFNNYGVMRRVHLEWIGRCRDAWTV